MIIRRYFFQELYLYFLVILLILLCVGISSEFMQFEYKTIEGNFNLNLIMKMLLIIIPDYLGTLLPFSLYLAILLVLGKMYSRNEITVLLTHGATRFQLLLWVTCFAFCISTVTAFFSLKINPVVESYQHKLMLEAAQKSLQNIIEKQFYSLKAGTTLYIQKTHFTENRLENIFFATQGKHPNEWDILVAKEGSLKQQGLNLIQLQNGARYTFTTDHPNMQILHYQNYSSTLPYSVPQKQATDASLSFRDLLKQQDPKTTAILQFRLAAPLSALILALIAFPLSQNRLRSGRSTQLIPAIIIYILYVHYTFSGKSWIEKGLLPMHWGLWWLHGIFLGLAILLNYFHFYKDL